MVVKLTTLLLEGKPGAVCTPPFSFHFDLGH